MSGLGNWVVDGGSSLRWEEGADGGGSELNLGPDRWGRAPAHWVSCVPLCAVTHTHPSSTRVPGAVPSPALMEKAQGLEGNGCVCFSLSPP